MQYEKMQTEKRKIYKVATLQDFGYPAVSLFAEMHSGQMYLFIASETDGKFGVIPISQKDLESYLGGETGLQNLMANGFYEGYLFQGEAIVSDSPAPSCRRAMAFYDNFDEELCYEDMQVLSFLYDIKHDNRLIVS